MSREISERSFDRVGACSVWCVGLRVPGMRGEEPTADYQHEVE